MNKPIIIFFSLLSLALVGSYLMFNAPAISTKSELASKDSFNAVPANIQQVKLGFKDYNYYPQEIRVKVDQPVRISLEDNVKGCYRAFTIKEFGVSKVLKDSKDYVEFTPNKKGSFTFACSMGMGTGKLIVE